MPTTDREDTDLEQVVNYYLDPKNLPTRGYEKRKQFIMMSVAVTGAGLYVVLAQNYAKRMHRMHGDTAPSPIHYILGNCLSSLAFLYNSTDFFISARDGEKIPEKLSQLLESPYSSPTTQILHDTTIATLSAISSIPIATLSFIYHAEWMSPSLVWVQTVVTEIDNTLMHFLPIYLAFKNPLYRFPILPFEYAYSCYRSRRETSDELDQQSQNERYSTIKQTLINELSKAQAKIQLETTTFNPRQLEYRIELNEDLRNILGDHTQKTDLEEQKATSYSTLMAYANANRAPSPKYNPIIGAICYGTGAVWVTSSCIGYVVQPINALTALTGNQIKGLLISLPSAYFLTVLLAFFGGTSFGRAYQYFTSWGQDQVKIPLEFKLYPKTAVACVAMSLYITYFSYAGANELIYTNFTEKDFGGIRPYLLFFAESGVMFLTMSSMLDLSRLLLNKMALHYGDAQTKKLVQIDTMINQLKNGIQMMNGEKLATSLKTMPAKSNTTAVNSALKEPAADETTPLLSSPSRRKKESYCGCLSRLFARLSSSSSNPRNGDPLEHKSQSLKRA